VSGHFSWHNVSVDPDDTITCSACPAFRAKGLGSDAVAVGHAHVANPVLPLDEVVAFVRRVPESVGVPA
jgi:hypothetical protein